MEKMLRALNEWITSYWAVPRFQAHVTTGNRFGAGTNSTVWMQLMDSTGSQSEKTCLDKSFVNDHERGETHVYGVSCKGLDKPEEIACISVWRDRTMIIDDRWFLDVITLYDTKEKKTYIFPVHRWIMVEKHYFLYEFDAFLPNEDKQGLTSRNVELSRKRKRYQYKDALERGPKQVKDLPDDEQFSFNLLYDIGTMKIKLLAKQKILQLTTGNWKSLEDINNIYVEGSDMSKPECIKYWKEDRWFGLQRVQGVNSVLIALCKEIPEKLAVTALDLEPFLEELTLEEALSKSKIFIVDLEVLNRVPCQKSVPRLVAPICLFYLNKKDELMPIAIQLFQEPSPTNPVYFPSDSPLTWVFAKMYFNMGDAQEHQSCTHLGLTHLLMETMCVAYHRNLSPSHPIFRLLAPHFLYLMAINSRGLKLLISPGGWVDTVMMVGRDGMFKLIGRTFQRWNLNIDGNVEKQIEKRGVLDPKILPHYPYRDDAVPLYNIIRSYVSKVVNFFYNTPEKLAADHEVQDWVKEMATSQSLGGCGIGGIPEKLETNEQLVDICTAIVSTCSLAHAGANFQQYEAYGFVPNYPPVLKNMPPQYKCDMIEEDLLKYLPNKKETLDTMVITTILSKKSTKSLGDFEVQYLYNPEVVQFADEFRLELKKLSNEIKAKNVKREFKYEWLDPEFVPNSISI